jgi:hypothetical protein
MNFSPTTNPSRRRTAILIVVIVSLLPLACNFLTRGPDLSGLTSKATEEAGKLISTLESSGSDSGQASTPQATQAALALDTAQPRTFRYAGLVFSLQRAAITSQPPDSGDFSVEEGAYAQTVWKVTNPNRDPARISQGVFTLQLGDGTKSTKAYEDYYNSQDTKELTIVFNVPANATWDNASLTFDEPGKAPAALPLQGAVPADPYPQVLTVSGEATLATPPLVYVLDEGTIDLDGVGVRAEQGTRYLLLKVTATCKDRYDCYVGPESFRVIIDGTPYAALTIDPVAEAVEPDTSQAFRLAFQIPEQVTQLDLQVGEASKETAKLPITIPTSTN